MPSPKGRTSAKPKKRPTAARVEHILATLADTYPDADCALDFANPYQLLVATILSAQCTDKRVNQVTPALFDAFPNPAALAAAELEVVIELIHSTGFFRNKASNIIRAGQQMVTDHGGEVPDTLVQWVKLPGVGRKTANVVLGNAFGVPGITVDTHLGRVCRRLGLTAEEDPVKVERALMDIIPEADWTHFSHRVIHHGRALCAARKPKCEGCPLAAVCPFP